MRGGGPAAVGGPPRLMVQLICHVPPSGAALAPGGQRAAAGYMVSFLVGIAAV